MRRALWIAAAALALSESAADRWLDATMPRLVLLAVPAWATLGILAVGRSGRTCGSSFSVRRELSVW